MGLFEHWPYVNFHDMNLDWIISKINHVETSEANTAQYAENAAESAAASQLSAEASESSAGTSKDFALQAAGSADSAAASEASAKNYADNIADPVSGIVADWLEDNITPTTPIVDESLTISGAAADAKKTGDEISDLKSELNDIEESFPPEAFTETPISYTIDWYQQTCDNSGNISANNSRIRTDYIPVGQGIFGTVNVNNRSYWIRCFDANKSFVDSAVADASGNLTISSYAAATPNPINVDSIIQQDDTIKYLIVVARDIDDSSAYVTPDTNGMSFTKPINVFSGVKLDSIYVRKNNAPYSASDIAVQYPVGNGYYTKGYLKLPPNYETKVGKTPLIVFVHGSGDMGYINDPKMTNNYNDYYNYLRDCGYAVFDCYAFSSKYPFNSTTPNTYGIPLNNECYKAGIEYVCSNYNISDEIFVACKSLGGIQALSMFYSSLFKVKAVGMLAPELDAFDINMGYTADVKRLIATELGFSPDTNNVLDFGANDTPPDGFWDYITSNIDKWCGIFPAFIGLPIPNADKPTYYKRLFDTSTMVRISPNRHIKIWIAQDDSQVSYNNALALVTSLNNSGAYAVLRQMPNNTGGHHSVDNDPNALVTTNVTTPLGITYASVPTAYYELEQFFRQFYPN